MWSVIGIATSPRLAPKGDGVDAELCCEQEDMASAQLFQGRADMKSAGVCVCVCVCDATDERLAWKCIGVTEVLVVHLG